MVYRVLGLMSGSSLDGLDIAFVELHEASGKWSYTLRDSACYEYPGEWVEKLRNVSSLNALEYQLLHAEYGQYTGEQVNRFIAEKNIAYEVQLIASHGHTSFHSPHHKMTAQLGHGAAIAASTGINVVSDLRAIDVALGGQGAPIVPIGEKLLFGEYNFFLNLGGIANISFHDASRHVAYDVSPANRVLNMLARKAGKNFDDGGVIASKGNLISKVFDRLNALEYYRLPYPKSLSNDFGTDIIYPMLTEGNPDLDDAMRTYVEHICFQILNAVRQLNFEGTGRMLCTGGGAKNTFLMQRLKELLSEANITIEVPPDELINYKEAIIMALIGVLRWREENNILASVTGASRNSINGAVWIGQEA